MTSISVQTYSLSQTVIALSVCLHMNYLDSSIYEIVWVWCGSDTAFQGCCFVLPFGIVAPQIVFEWRFSYTQLSFNSTSHSFVVINFHWLPLSARFQSKICALVPKSKLYVVPN